MENCTINLLISYIVPTLFRLTLEIASIEISQHVYYSSKN